MNRKLSRNLVLNMLYQILTLIVPFITTPYVGRILGSEGVGVYTYAHSVASYFALFALMGIRNYGSRAIAEVRDDMDKRSIVFSEIYAMQLGTGFVTLITYLIYVFLFCKTDCNIAFIFSFYIFSLIVDVSWFFSGMEDFKAVVFRGIFIKLINLILVFVFVRQKSDIVQYAIIFVLGEIIGQLALWPIIRKQVKYCLPKISSVVKRIKPNILLFIPALATSIYQIMDKIMIGAIATKTDLAYYEYADKFISIPNVLSTAIGAVMLSHISNAIANKKDGYKETMGNIMDLTFIICSACGFGLLSIADELVFCYYGEDFLPSITVLKLLIPVIFLYAWANVLRMQYIIPSKKDLLYIRATVIGAAVNLCINAMLIPDFASVGAAIGTIMANLSVAFVFAVALRKELPITSYVLNNLGVITAGAVMFLVVRLFKHFHGDSWIGIGMDLTIAVITFLISLTILAKINKKHIAHSLLNILSKNKI